VYHRILEIFEGWMLQATQGIQDPRLQLKVALEETLKIYDECEDAVRLLYQESHTLGRQGLQGLFEVDRTYVGIFREILERGTRNGQFAAKDPYLLAVCILFLCLDTVIGSLTGLVLNGISADRPVEFPAQWSDRVGRRPKSRGVEGQGAEERGMQDVVVVGAARSGGHLPGRR
jgi:hypothetical protein